ncbi:molybdate ABC transporter permease subunit [Jeotgalibacillus proteolyticus]|uniref:Molybdenum transport system permease n=1 Tax=Jeotgalibacillus proteolyticus TaxID=2082395 RepID=A0A2S5GBL5_9BACL|nr:molybdate ABC transporter permease subunit [Jeotgalibacillus proteolyticus]PPA70422.1 molybdate ABC transporter permease subunit [Jeotgalibacillus proteolyticus]
MLGPEFWTPVWVSVRVVLLASTLAFLLAIAAAWLLKKRTFRGKTALETVLMLPLVLPPTVVGFGLLVLLGRNSVVGSGFEWLFGQPIVFTYIAAVIAATVVAFPLVYQMLINGFEEVDSELEAAARQMGASEIEVFRFVTLPLSWRQVTSGFMLGLARALGEFGATLMFAGSIFGVTQTVPVSIYLAVETGNYLLAYYWVGSIILFSFVLLAFVQQMRK